MNRVVLRMGDGRDRFRAVSGVDLQVTGELLIELVVSCFPLLLKMLTTFCVPDVGH